MKRVVYSGNGKWRDWSLKNDNQQNFDYCILLFSDTFIHLQNNQLLDFSNNCKYLPAVQISNRPYFFNTNYLNRPFDKIIKKNLTDITSPEIVKNNKLSYYHMLYCKIKGFQDNNAYIEDQNTLQETLHCPFEFFSEMERDKCYCICVDSTNRKITKVFYNINDQKVIDTSYINLFKL